MSTIKQQLAVENTVENGGNITRAMREAGYAEATSNNPSNLTSSKGYKELLAQCGLTENLITTALVADIKAKEGKRATELALGAELLGMRKMGAVVANKISIQSDAEAVETDDQRQFNEELALVFEQYLKAKLGDQESVTISIVH